MMKISLFQVEIQLKLLSGVKIEVSHPGKKYWVLVEYSLQSDTLPLTLFLGGGGASQAPSGFSHAIAKRLEISSWNFVTFPRRLLRTSWCFFKSVGFFLDIANFVTSCSSIFAENRHMFNSLSKTNLLMKMHTKKWACIYKVAISDFRIFDLFDPKKFKNIFLKNVYNLKIFKIKKTEYMLHNPTVSISIQNFKSIAQYLTPKWDIFCVQKGTKL